MADATQIRAVFINLPIRDVSKTRAFWSNLGFTFSEQYSDEKALCLRLKDDEILAMLIAEDYFRTFTHRPVSDRESTQVLLAIDVGSRGKVEQIMRLAVENGAKRYLQPEDQGFMYYDRFTDPDGHQWEIMTLAEPAGER